jgi:hypothetical protein
MRNNFHGDDYITNPLLTWLHVYIFSGSAQPGSDGHLRHYRSPAATDTVSLA